MKAEELKRAFAAQQRREPFAFLYEVLFSVLRWAIITEQYTPGDMLKDGEIASLLEVSRTPVSRALEMLKERGLLLASGKSGYLVAPLNSLTLQEIIDFRASLEPAIAYDAAKNASQKDLNELRDCLQSYKHLTKEQRTADVDGYIESAFQAEVSFHTKLAQMCTNSMLRKAYLDNMPQIMRSLYFFSRYYGFVEDTTDTATEFYKMHQHIFYSLQARDGHMAMNAVFSHLRRADLRAIQYD